MAYYREKGLRLTWAYWLLQWDTSGCGAVPHGCIHSKEMNMKVINMTLAAAALSLIYAGPLSAADDAMPKDQYKAEKQRIEKEGKAAKEKCKDMKGNEKDKCMAEAKGQEKVAKAELEAKNKDTPKNRYDVAAAKADMEYDVAKEKCDDMKGKEKDACQKDAKAARDSAKKSAKADREAAEGKKEKVKKSS
jgi:hypothetical protein